MPAHKKTVKHKESKKKVVKKHTVSNAAEKKPEEEKKPQSPEVQHDSPLAPQAPISESVGGPVVIPSGVMQDTPKEEPPQIETVSAKAIQPESLSQPIQQVADALTSQPESATNNTPSVEPIATQDPFAVDSVVKGNPDQELIEEPKKKRPWVIIGLIIVGIVLIVGVLWYFRENAIKQISVQDNTTSTPSLSKISPTPASDSAKLVIDYSKYKIKVLNGSGIGGAAAKGKEILESEKFIVEEIGNAETSDYEKTIIKAKKEVPTQFLDKLKSVLKETYLLGSSEKLEDSEDVDVVIVIGSGKQP